MHKRLLPLTVAAFAVISFLWSCTKLDTTDIGSGLLPAVDNVNTFDTTLSITTTQGIFNDSSIVGRSDDHVLGFISNDPLFGQTSAGVYMQLKPPFYPYFIGGVPLDTIVGLDSVVLCLKYKGSYGDTNSLVRLNAYQIFSNEFRDSFNAIRNVNYTFPAGGSLGPLIGSAMVDIRNLDDTIHYKNRRDYSVNTIRIKMDASWATTLFLRDSTTSNIANNAFLTDTLFRKFYNGLAVTSDLGNALVYTNLLDTNTKLEIHYRKRYNNVIDTVYTSFKLNDGSSSTISISSTANVITRNRSGAAVSSPSSDEIFLQTSPGTYARLNIPALPTLNNRIIHRAEIIVEQIPNGINDDKFVAPAFLYLDLKDTTTTTDKWKPIYFDLNPSYPYDPDFKVNAYFPDQIDYTYFGGFRREKSDGFGNTIKYYTFNISRYVQKMVTQGMPNYEMRLFAPFKFSYPQYFPTYLPAGGMNSIAFGRIRVGSGTNANYKMRLRIIYSRI